ncbi:MAG TPA: sigma 54-interacting transcriptional regulator [Nitrospira sp.]|nr:sigma 54-interacting transcriptional regulator [Nitrospira sp.]
MDRYSASPCETLAERYQALLEVAQAISAHRDIHELFRDLAQRLPRVVHVNFVALSLHDPERNTMRLHTIQANVPADLIGGHEEQVEETPAGLAWRTQQPVLVPDLADERRWPNVTQRMKEDGTNSFCVVPLTTAVRRLGAMGFSSLQKEAYAETDLEFLQQVGKQVAVAVDNVLHHQDLTHDRDRLRLLLEVSESIASHRDLEELFSDLAQRLPQIVPFDYINAVLHEPARDVMRLWLLVTATPSTISPGLELPVDESPGGLVWKTQQPLTVNDVTQERRFTRLMAMLRENGVQSFCVVPLTTAQRRLGAMGFGSLQQRAYQEAEINFMQQVAKQIAVAVENALGYKQIAELKEKLSKEKLYLEEEIRTEYNFEEIIGESTTLKKVLKQVEVVAPTDSTVLILGETGTGKELLARAIHNVSERRERTFVKINCAAIPTGLLESELFGHERGAFTGAIATKVGRFELADGGTLFLDEVGDIPLELQSKLLRVLQEQEFERLGSTRTLKVNVRVVAATNQDLSDMVEKKEFRNDLYYRLNVFPLMIPPLRERREDIPVLVRYFTQKFARQLNRPIERIPADTMDALTAYAWPGNIRELENLVERAVILSTGLDLVVPLSELKASRAATHTAQVSTLESAEREHIIRALNATNWIIGGPAGAAVKLGMKRTTLQSKMQKLGVTRPS